MKCCSLRWWYTVPEKKWKLPVGNLNPASLISPSLIFHIISRYFPGKLWKLQLLNYSNNKHVKRLLLSTSYPMRYPITPSSTTMTQNNYSEQLFPFPVSWEYSRLQPFCDVNLWHMHIITQKPLGHRSKSQGVRDDIRFLHCCHVVSVVTLKSGWWYVPAELFVFYLSLINLQRSDGSECFRVRVRGIITDAHVSLKVLHFQWGSDQQV